MILSKILLMVDSSCLSPFLQLFLHESRPVWAAFVFGDVMKKWAEKFYNSKKWKCCRNAYISERILIDGGLCEVCGESTGYIVHHKISLDSSNINNPEIALNNKNLMYVCKDCHDKFDGHFADMRSNSRHTKGLRVCFDEDGYPSPRSDNGHG